MREGGSDWWSVLGEGGRGEVREKKAEEGKKKANERESVQPIPFAFSSFFDSRFSRSRQLHGDLLSLTL